MKKVSFLLVPILPLFLAGCNQGNEEIILKHVNGTNVLVMVTFNEELNKEQLQKMDERILKTVQKEIDSIE